MIAVHETKDLVQMIRDLLAEHKRVDAMRLARDMFDPVPETVGELNRFMRTLMGELPRRCLRVDEIKHIAGSSTYAVAVESNRARAVNEMRAAIAAAEQDMIIAGMNATEDHAFWVLPRAERTRLRNAHKQAVDRFVELAATAARYGVGPYA